LSLDSERVERLVKMAERLIEAIEADIVALKAGKPQQMRSIEPEMQRLSALYGREAQGFTPASAKDVPTPLRKRFIDTTSRFRDLLNLHARMLTRVRNASEGMIRAIAEEVERQSAPSRTYTAKPATAARPAQAMIYNSVI
jgi:hypothetical protein